MDVRRVVATGLATLIIGAWLFFGTAQASPPFDPNKQNLYGRLVVTVQITGGSQTVNDCPSGGVIGMPIKDIAKTLKDGNKDYAFLVTISSGGAEVNFSPVTMHVKHRTFGTDCEASLRSFIYRSPMYYLGNYGSTKFTIANKEVLTTQPASAVSQASSSLLNLASTVEVLPKAVADKAAAPIAAIIGDFDNHASFVSAREIEFTKDGANTLPPWRTSVKLGSNTYAITVEQKLENAASIFLNSAVLTPFADTGNPSALLNKMLLPDAMANLQGQKDATRFIVFAADDERKAVAAAADYAALDTPCQNLFAKLQTAGLSEVDAAALSWAVVVTHPNPKLHGAEADQIGCLQQHKAALTSAGVTLRPPPKPIEDKADPRVETLNWVTADQSDIPFDFFGSSDPGVRTAAADALFVKPVTVADSFGAVVPSGVTSVNGSAEWYMLLNQAGRLSLPIFDRFGCYRVIGAKAAPLTLDAAAMYAIGEINVARENAPAGEYVLRLDFAKVAAADTTPKLTAITITRSANADVLKFIKGSRAACGQSWKPKLLWP